MVQAVLDRRTMVEAVLDRVPILFGWDEDRTARWNHSDDNRVGSGDRDAVQIRNDQSRVLSRMGLESDDDNLSDHSSWSSDTMASGTSTLISTGDEDGID